MSNSQQFMNPRAVFRFDEHVGENFRFLETEYGFRKVESNPTYVRYETDRVFVQVYHGRQSFYIGVEVGLIQKEGRSGESGWVLDSILELHGVNTGHGLTAFQSSDPSGVAKFLPILAELLRLHGRAALVGSQQEYEDLLRLNSVWFHDSQARQVLSLGEQAWSERNYHRVVELFGSVLDRLSPAQRRKFEYAFKHLDG